jgi:hypothetical protein
VPVNEADREETEKEWNTLSFKEQFDGFQWATHNLPDNRAPTKYWLPQNFLKKKMWTRLGMGRAQYRAPIDDDRPLVGVQVPMR